MTQSFNMPTLTPEQQAASDDRHRRYGASLEAGKAGKPRPEGVIERAYLSGVARRRTAAGEAIGFICQSSLCSSCGEQNWGWRLGCSCWPTDSLSPAGFSMTHGFQVEEGSDPADPSCTFMSFDRITELAKGGREVLDIMSGEPVPVEAKEQTP